MTTRLLFRQLLLLPPFAAAPVNVERTRRRFGDRSAQIWYAEPMLKRAVRFTVAR